MEGFSKATSQDIPTLNKLINSAYRGESAKQGWTHEAELLSGIRVDEEELNRLIHQEGTSVIKYTNDDTIIACMLLEQQNDFLYLGMLTVSPDLQAKGIGKLLLNEAEVQAAAVSISKIRMTVISSRRELIDWYKRHGYKDTGIKKPFPTDSKKFGLQKIPLEFILMEKTL